MMKTESRSAFLMLLAVLIVCAPPAGATRPAASTGASPQVSLPVAGREAPLRLLAGRSMVINSGEEILKRVSVTDDKVAYAVIVSPNQVLIHGLKPGTVTLILWNEDEEMKAFQLQVEVDLAVLRDAVARTFPGENIQIAQSGEGVVLTGTVSSPDVPEKVTAVVKTGVQNVVNLLNVPLEPSKVVLLQVRFAEVERGALKQLGANLLSTGALNTPGRITTGQFSPQRGGASLKGQIGAPVSGFSTEFELSDLLNVFLFRPDLNLGALIKALQQRSNLQILAEPNLLALGGKEASFLAGGEFPVPVVQAGAGLQTVTVQYKEFGVRLKFVANPRPDGGIHLKVTPEVSALDYANALTLSGFVIPALTTRRADTEVDLRDGQSFAIAGLMDKRTTEVMSKIPWLGDVPLLGKLFQSREFKQNNTELLVMVTPQVVRPLEPGQGPPLPEFPLPFLEGGRLDGKAGEGTAAQKKPSN